MSAVIESLTVDGTPVRIRRRGKGKAGRFDSPLGLPYLLEYVDDPNQPDEWTTFRSHNHTTGARWDRYSTFGGPRPGPDA
jgi:hypothetical protein